MDDQRAAVVREWLVKAERDLASALRLLDGEPPFLDTAVYHCQQAAEKALKGFLASRDRPLRRVHDLVLLVDECADLDAAFAQLAEAAEILTPYGTAFRYPGDVSQPQPTEAREAVTCEDASWTSWAGHWRAEEPGHQAGAPQSDLSEYLWVTILGPGFRHPCRNDELSGQTRCRRPGRMPGPRAMDGTLWAG